MHTRKHLYLPKCLKDSFHEPCWLCDSHSGDVHPVDAYRNWDRMWGFHNHGTRAHWSTVWLIASPFLEERGYKIQTELVDQPKQRPRLVTPHDRILKDQFDLSILVCPATDKDGNEVFIKTFTERRRSHNEEFTVHNFLLSDKYRSHPLNHTIPILDILYFQPDFRHFGRDFRMSDMRAFVVMPKHETVSTLSMADLHTPTVADVKQCLEFAAQMTGGLAFMHCLGVFHGDIHDANMVVSKPSSGKRTYYYIDFQGSGQHVHPEECSRRIKPFFVSHLRYLPRGASQLELFDPFASDVLSLGSIFNSLYHYIEVPRCPSERAVEVIPDVWKLLPGFIMLVQQMLRHDPDQRPTARSAARAVRRSIALLRRYEAQFSTAELESGSATRAALEARENLQALEQLPTFSSYQEARENVQGLEQLPMFSSYDDSGYP